jgi:putative aldouronate transport system substrate-binding protein
VSLIALRAFGGGAKAATSTGGGGGVTLPGFLVFTQPDGVGNITRDTDQLSWKWIDQNLGIHVDWTNAPDSGEWQAQLGLIMASGNLPDFFIRITPQLAEQYGRQGALVSLTDIIDTKVPDLKAKMNANKAVQGMMTSADGKIYFFPRLLLDPRTRHYPGLMIREDWVKSLGLSMPDTVDDFYNVLKAIKAADFDKNGKTDEAPFMGDYKFLIWAFGAGSRGVNQFDDFFVENGQIKYGPTDPRYRTAVEYLNKLYGEGLITPSPSGDALTQGVLNETVASTYGSWAGYLTTYNKLLAGAGKNPGFRGITPLKGPTGERNALSHHTEIDLGMGGAISSTSKKTEDVARLFNFFYSKEGNILIDFGIEGDTYTMVNGVPTYTNKVLNHPTLSVLNYLNAYVSFVSGIPSELLVESYLPTLSPEGVEGNRITAAADVLNKKPPTLRFSDAEIVEVQALQRDIDTYVDENRDKFINGQLPFGQWNSFQTGLQQLRVSRLVELYNAAYQRFLAASR